MENAKLFKLFDNFIEDNIINNELLRNIGFTDEEITELINTNILKYIGNDTYSIKSIDSVFRYAKVLRKNYPEKAEKCLLKCFAMNKNNFNINHNLFRQAIFNMDFDKALYYYKYLSTVTSKYHKTDVNYYFYLLSKLIDIPKEYQDSLKSLTLDSILVPEDSNGFLYIPEVNNIRRLSFEGSYTYAFKQINDLIYNHKEASNVVNQTSRFLIKRIIEKKNEMRNNLIDLIKNKDYEMVKSILEEQQDNLERQEVYVLKLVNVILDIKNNGIIPKKDDKECQIVFDYIDNCDFEGAYKRSLEYNKEFSIDNDKNMINLLLKDITDLIKNYNKPKDNVNPMGLYALITAHLVNNNINEAKVYIDKLLKIYDKENLSFLINDLIDISVLEQDPLYTKPVVALTLIMNNHFKLDYNDYLKEYYVAVAYKKLNVANLYLDIITKLNGKLPVVEPKEVVKEEEPKKEVVEKTIVVEQPQEVKKPVKKEPKKEIAVDQGIIQLLNKKREELVLNKGIILLDVSHNYRYNEILEATKLVKDIDGFLIDNLNRRQIVLRYKPKHEETVDVKSLYKEANDAYHNSNFKECIEKYVMLLSVFAEPKSYIYTRIGLSYLKLHDNDNAIKYLTVADYLGKKEQVKSDFGELIFKLRKEIPLDSVKPKFEITENDFKEDYYYGVNNFDEIYNYIIDNKLDVETACNNLNLDEEHKNLVMLVFAKLYYSKGYNVIGDAFIKCVEKSKSKTDNVKSILDYIRRNKQLLTNKGLEKELVLSLTLKPNVR